MTEAERQIIDKLDQIINLLGQIGGGDQWQEEEPDWNYDATSITACCSYPPGDGSTCAGGTCCCTDGYECDKCKGERLRGTP